MSSSNLSNPTSSPKDCANQKNDSKLVCQICSSVVLQPNAANFWADKTCDMPLARQQKGVETQKEAVEGFWGVNDMFSFENVGFTHSVDGVKYLTCAECEYGPIGFVDPETKVNYVSPNRLVVKD